MSVLRSRPNEAKTVVSKIFVNTKIDKINDLIG